MCISISVPARFVLLLSLLTATCMGQDIVVNEIMYYPYSGAGTPENTHLEFIELFNAGPDAVTLKDWQLTAGVGFVFPEMTLSAGGYLVVAADQAAFRAAYPTVENVIGDWTGRLVNSGETIELCDASGATVDTVSYVDEGDWAVRELGPAESGQRGWQWSDQADGGGKSLSLLNVAMPNEFGQNWTASLVNGGTPGRPNLVATDDIAPIILDVEQDPFVPGPTDRVKVTARVIDEVAVPASVCVRYRVDRSAYLGQNVYPQANSSDFAVVTMLDDGTHGDDFAGDGIYGAEIPPHPDGTIIEFYVEAVDEGGLMRMWPAPSLVDGQWQQVTNCLYRVDATFDPAVHQRPGSQPLYYMVMTEMERGRLEYIGTHSGQDGPNSQMNATFISIEGTGARMRYQVGVRNRGHGSRNGPPNNYHINFPHDAPWRGRGAINFNCRNTHLQILGGTIFHMAGIAAPDAVPAQLRINGANLAYAGSPMYGVYVRLDAFNDDFAQDHFPHDPDGNLYTCFRLGNNEADLRYEGENPDIYRNRYFKANNTAEDDWSDLIHLVDVLNNAPEETYLQEVGEAINIPQWLRYIALNSLFLNYETGLDMGMGDDYFMYRGVTDPRFVLIPHDLDTILGQGGTGNITQSIFSIVEGAPGHDGVDGLRRFFTHPAVIALYHGQMIELMNTVFSPEKFDPLVDQVLGEWVPDQIRSNVKQFVVRRNAAVLDQIPLRLTISSTQPAVDGFLYTSVNACAISGTADAVRTHSVLVNGVPATWSPRGGTWLSGGGFGLADSLLEAGSQWRFLDDGSDQGSAWSEPRFDDTSWRSGRAQLGYGDNDEVTVVNGGPSNNRYITTYFRALFSASRVSEYSVLHLHLLCDDGAVVYLNGVEACRSGMPEGPIDYMTRANTSKGGAEESVFVDFELPAGLLREGENVLAVEIHQTSPTSSDISFDLALEGVRLVLEEGTLVPGINRIIVQSYDGQDGAGSVVEEGYVDIWYDDGAGSQVSGVLAADRVLDVASGPWYVTGTMTVPVGVTLRIEPGATLFFDPGTRLIVNGTLIAEGSPYQRITFTKRPGGGNWAGVQFLDTETESRLIYVSMSYSDAGSCAILADHARVHMDHVTWGNHTKQYLTFDDSSIVLKNSILPSLQEAELVHFWGMPSDGYALFEGNRFGTTTGYNDIIDFTGGQRPGPIARFINNTFTGASDDCIDLDGADAHIEGNVFMHVHGDPSASSQSHAVTTGTENGQYSELTVVRNLFYDVDHAFLSKDGGFIMAINNTVVHATHAAVNMYEARSGQWQGRGFYGDGNIFYDVAHVFENPDWAGHPSDITMNNSMFPVVDGDPVVWTGVGNIEDADPQFRNATNLSDLRADLQLLPGSSAIGAGPNGRDMGGVVPAGASLSGEPFPMTWRTQATLTVGGPDIYAYKYRVNGGPWSAPVFRPGGGSAADPQPLPAIELTNLQNGQSYTVQVIGMNSAGVWQSENNPTASRTWVVDTSDRYLVINEVLAANASAVEHEGTFPDMIELYYDGPSAVSLSGMSITDDLQRPRRFVFPAGVTMAPGEYLVLYADDETVASGLHLGFGLKTEGDAVYLYSAAGALVDSVEFGAQLPDLSVGRFSAAETWRLAFPTFGQANIPYPLGDPRSLKVNEWLANGEILFASDFVELFNPRLDPVALGGMYLTDNPMLQSGMHELKPLTFIAGAGYAAFWADGSNAPGHLDFRLSADGEMIGLFDSQLRVVDKVLYGTQAVDISQGRVPDGGPQIEYLALPTPGNANPAGENISTTALTLVEASASKRVLVPTEAVADEWKGGGPFDDSAWALCTGEPGGVGFERDRGYESLITLDTESEMYGAGKNNSCYLRIPFIVVPEDLVGMDMLVLKVLYDDGFVAYLNGTEVARARFTGTPSWNSRADSAGESLASDFDEYIDISPYIEALRSGTNVLAVHAMNASSTSSDFLINVAIDAVSVKVQGQVTYEGELDLLKGLRITEIMHQSPNGTSGDYIELANIGDKAIDVTGVRFTRGIDFTFPSMIIQPGDYAVIADDLAVFQSLYGVGVRVAGQYSGNLSNSGEELVLSLSLPWEAAILRFEYDGSWYPTTSGGGDALAINDPFAPPAAWSQPESWHPVGPSPGTP